jgi:hypothetical protein
MAWNHAATLFTVWRDLFLTSSFVSHQRNVMADLIIARKKLSQPITSTAESGKPEGETGGKLGTGENRGGNRKNARAGHPQPRLSKQTSTVKGWTTRPLGSSFPNR